MRIMGTAERIGIRRVCALLIALALVFVCAIEIAPARAESDGMIRVRLTRLGAPAAITLAVDCEYYLAKDPTVRIESGDTVTVTAGGDGLTLEQNGRRVALGDTARLMRAQSGNRGIRFLQPELSNRFCGDLGLSASGGVISAILNIYVENYLYGVVGYAMSPSADIEALKAQAVASRTFALRRKADRTDAAYDVTDTAADQIFKGYNGTSDYADVVRAVDDTRGCAVYYDNALAQVSYCASNGGQTESARNAFGVALPYTEVRDDPYDFESASATVKTASVNKDLTDLNPILKTALIEGMRAWFAEHRLSTEEANIRVNFIESVTACDSRFAAPSRLYKSLTFKLNVTGVAADGQSHTGTVSVSIPTYGSFEDWYDLSINPEENETVWVTESERAFNVSLRRSGSGVGLSQRGAQVMAANYGKKAQEILQYYYPGTELRPLELADATRDQRAVEPARDQQAIATGRLGGKTDLLGAPDADAAATATVAAGAVVDIYGVQDDWVAVGSSGKYGFVRADALESFSLSGADVVRAEDRTYGTLAEGTPVLQLPVSGAKVLETVGGAGAVRVYAWTDAWAMVETPGGQTGFAAISALSFAAPETTPEPALVTESTEEIAPAADSAQDIDGGPIHKVKGRKYMYVSAGLARVYERWSESSATLITLYHGERVRVGAYNTRWACVKAEGVTGFVRADALSVGKPAAIEGGSITRAGADAYALPARDGVTVYASYSADSEKVGALHQGQQVQVEAYNAAWAMVRAGEIAGFVRIEDLAPSDGVQAVQPYEARVTANVKVYAAVRGKVVGQLAKGASVRVTAVKGDYACIEYNGGRGFVKKKFLKRK